MNAVENRWSRWRVVLVCALSQNLTMGIAYGSFSPLLARAEAELGVSRFAVTISISVMSLAMGLATFLLGPYFARRAPERLMVLGSLVCAAAYFGIANTNRLAIFVALYGAIGFGTALAGLLGPITLINKWCVSGRGKALGIVNLPLLLFAVPILSAELVEPLGRNSIMAAFAIAFVALAGVQTLLLPGAVRAVPTLPATAAPGLNRTLGEGCGQVAGMRRAPFWLISLGVGLTSGGASVFFVHAVPFGTMNGMDIGKAALLLSVYSGVGILSPLIFGWLADRTSGLVALILAALGQAVAWFGLSLAAPTAYFPLAALFGFSAVSIIALHQIVMGEILSSHELGKGYGVSYLVKMPFMFVFAPFIALVSQRFASYDEAFLLCGVIMMLAATLFVLAAIRRPRDGARDASPLENEMPC